VLTLPAHNRCSCVHKVQRLHSKLVMECLIVIWNSHHRKVTPSTSSATYKGSTRAFVTHYFVFSAATRNFSLYRRTKVSHTPHARNLSRIQGLQPQHASHDVSSPSKTTLYTSVLTNGRRGAAKRLLDDAYNDKRPSKKPRTTKKLLAPEKKGLGFLDLPPGTICFIITFTLHYTDNFDHRNSQQNIRLCG
jgi:hypothetical protein